MIPPTLLANGHQAVHYYSALLYSIVLVPIVYCRVHRCALRSMWLTLELWFHFPGLGGERPEHVASAVSDEQQGGPPPGQARHHPGVALSMQLCGEQ